MKLTDLKYAVRDLREAAHLTQAELGQLAGIDRVSVWRIETGKTDGYDTTLPKLLAALGMEMDVTIRKIQEG